MQNKRYILLGLKHSGKTSLAEGMSRQLGIPWFDIDHRIEKLHPEFPDIRSMYRENGLRWFQEQECMAYESIGEPHCIIACGGGAMENQRLMELLRPTSGKKPNTLRIFIDGPEELLYARILKNGIPPFLSAEKPREDFRKLYLRRRELGRSNADLIISTGDNPKEEVLQQLLDSI